MNWNKNNRIIAFFVFVLSFVVYALTISPTVSYWDCGEFIACSYTLAVPHPPGAPLYLLIGRFFSMIPFVKDIALRVNFISVIASALTIMLLYLSIVHLIREWKGSLKSSTDWQIAIFSGLLGAFTFAFTHSFWFNAVEAEVYAPSMLCTSLLVWLILVWAEKADQPGNEKYLLMIAYLIGLAIGIHLLNVLALPFVTLIIFYKKYKFTRMNFLITIGITIAIILLVYPGIVKYLPIFALEFGVTGLVILLIALIWFTLWALNHHKKMTSLISLSVLLIIIGYSTYAMIYIRSNLNPMIDENDPETAEKFVKYLEREQYGEHSIVDRPKVWRDSPNGKRYASAWGFFWKYQVDKMYIRYFMWQFVGLSENEEDIDPKQFYYIPLLLGLLGMYWQFKNDYKNGLAVLALFFMTGLAIILYLNQPDPQPRERDYSYVGSFFAFSIWIGLGYAGMIELLIPKKNGQNKEFQLKILRSVIFVILLIITPINMIAKNYHSHDRTGNYVAWDYSYNMLQSCEPGGIIFTNGDNDTFPLWYLQEVEKVRTDIRIVNLSLLNTGWYIKQLRDLEPKVPINISDYQLETQLGVIKWEKQKCVLKVPQAVSEKYTSDFQKRFDYFDLNVPKEIMFEVRPTMSIPNGPSLLRVQDWMILNILAVNKWSKPVYFAVTVSKDNMLSDLQQYLRMDGLSLKIVPFRNWEISPDHLEKNLVHVYQYRGLQDSSVYYDSNIQGLIQNYRSAFLQLIEYYAHAKEMNKVNYLLNVMEMKLPGSVIPWTNKYLQIIRDSYLLAMNAAKVDSMIVMYPNEQELVLLGENLYRLDFFEAAEKIFAYIYNVNSSNIRALSILINIYEVTKNYKSAIKCLENHLNINPNDTVARQKLTYLKRLVKE